MEICLLRPWERCAHYKALLHLCVTLQVMRPSSLTKDNKAGHKVTRMNKWPEKWCGGFSIRFAVGRLIPLWTLTSLIPLLYI